ncbi:MAG: hypothetical protein GY845_25380 [Planctomycetes bacterium]|nr:hypothetical protein [Planctomycetota bacterium]
MTKHSLDDPEVIRVPDAHEAIIPRDLWEQAQRLLDKRRPQPGQIRVKKHDFILSGLLWCDEHDCTITGTGNSERRYYRCDHLRQRGRKGSDCALLHKDNLERFVLDVLKDQVFTQDRIAEAITHVIELSKSESTAADGEVKLIRTKISKLQREIENLNEALAQGTILKSTIQEIGKRENYIADLERQVQDIKKSNQRVRFADLKVNNEMIEAIRSEAIQALDTESPQNLRSFLRYYIECIKLKGDSLSIKFAFGEPPHRIHDNSQVMVAGVGFEPTTFGL